MPTILIADDDKATRMVLKKVLCAHGMNVIVASDGLRARTVLEDNSDIELLITDVVMPLIDGRDLVSGLRRERKYEQLGIIVMSATVTVGEITRLLELGASRFLAKPINDIALMREVSALLEL